MSKLEIRAGGQDWATIWREMYLAERSQAEALTPDGLVDPADYWARSSQRFQAAAQRVNQPDSFMRFALPLLRQEDRVADIGAGTGRYLPTLAGHCGSVVAVEPSPSMRAHLEAVVQEQNLANVEVVAQPWPEARIGQCDVALSAHVLYSVAEVAPFLLAMDAVAQRACILLLALKHPTSFMDRFWLRFRGEPRRPLPGALEALNLLYQLGISANLQVIPTPSVLRYVNHEEALVDVRYRLRFLPDPERDAAISQAISELMIDEDGELLPQGIPRQAAVIWWEK